MVMIEPKTHNYKSNYVTQKDNYEIIFKMFLIYNIVSFFVYIITKQKSNKNSSHSSHFKYIYIYKYI